MSWQPCDEALCSKSEGAIELLIRSRVRDLGGFSVRRVLPAPERRMVGPYIFFDHMGPTRLPPGKGLDVRPHPHIGLSTVTWLFEGEILHRDSLGSVQAIRPGAVNLMTAGRGIVHSERTPPEVRKAGGALHGIQLWLALPAAQEEAAPAFAHTPSGAIPQLERPGCRLRIIIGEACGLRSPVEAPSPTLYGEALFTEAAELELPGSYRERAVYLVEGRVALAGSILEEGEMAVLREGAGARLRSLGPARAMLLGGEPFAEARSIWWNFVSTSRERIDEAKRDWAAGRFPKVPGESEFIPLPD